MKRFLLITMLFGCGEADLECRHASECPSQHACMKHVCKPLDLVEVVPAASEPEPQPQPQPNHSDEPAPDVDATAGDDASSMVDAPIDPLPPHPCAQARAPQAGDLVINEVYANVAPGDAGDANGDGVRDAYSDEFVEIVNVGTDTLKLDTVALFVGTTLKFRFDEPYCLQPSRGLVVFSRGTPSLSPDISVITADTRLTLTNAGGSVQLKRDQTVLDRFDWGEGPQTSMVRQPELSFSGIPTSHEVCGLLWSPGRCCDGQPLESGCGAD